jgi:hypothetical protein
MKSTLSILIAFLLSSNLFAQTTLIPDVNFEQALINLGYDAVIDGSVSTANINTVTFLDISNQSINDLTGIEDFTSLSTLYCNDNLLTYLNLSNNVSLLDLRCYNNQISGLDFSNNTALLAVNCANNLLSALVVSNSSDLTYLNCQYNQLVTLNLANQALSQLLVNNNPPLTTLFCNDNQLTSLDLSTNPALENLRCQTNQLTSLDLSNNVNLDNVSCRNNQITSIDVSNLTSLIWGEFQNNQLTSLDMRNGNNTNFNYFNSTNNPSLLCIGVDDVAWSNANWSNDIDNQSYFSIDCLTTGISENSLSNIFLHPNPTNGELTIELGDITKEAKVSLTNSLGQVIFNQKFEITGSLKFNLDAPAGIYLLQFQTANGNIITKKVIKE